jgi:hypothetical protein
MRWAGHVAYVGRWEIRTEFLPEVLKGRDHFGELGDGRIILNWTLKNLGEKP